MSPFNRQRSDASLVSAEHALSVVSERFAVMVASHVNLVRISTDVSTEVRTMNTLTTQ